MKQLLSLLLLILIHGCITINPAVIQPSSTTTTQSANSNNPVLDTPALHVVTKYQVTNPSTTLKPVNVQFEASSEDLTARKLAKPDNVLTRSEIFKTATANSTLKASDQKNDIVRLYSNKDGKRKTPFIYSFAKDESKAQVEPDNCITTTYTFNCNSSTFMNADYESQGQYIYPSAIYRMKEFENGEFDEVAANRNDVTLLLDVADVKKSTFVTVNNPNIVTLREGVRTLYDNLDDTRNGNMDFRYRIFESNNTIERQLKTTAGGGISFGPFGGTSDNTSEEERKESHRYLTVDIIKDLFTITSLPNKKYFADSIVDTSLVVVNSVTYGMRLLANIDITNMETKNTSTSNNSASFFAANGHLNLSSLTKTLKGNTTINCYVVGGPINGKCSFTIEDFETKIQEMVGGTSFNNARPIQYSLSDLDGNIYSVQSSVTNLKQTVCKPTPAITNFDYTFLTGNDDKDDQDHVSITFTLLPANKIIYENKDVRPREPDDSDPTWHNESAVPAIPETEAISQEILKSDPNAKQIQVIVRTSKGDHWHMGYDFKLIMSDGSKILLSRQEPEINGNPTNNFGDGGGGIGRSRTWIFPIPWNGVSNVGPQKRVQVRANANRNRNR